MWVKDVVSFPVGRVEFLYLHPLNFHEYLEAIGRQDLQKQLQEIPVKTL
jgi:predicted AAA+ superfamily ATPase